LGTFEQKVDPLTFWDSSRIVLAMNQVVRAFVLFALLIIGAIIPLSSSATQVFALSSPCSLDPNNLIYNGAMREGGLSQYGPVADGWNAFVLSGSPGFDWVDNEGRDPYGSQYIFGDSQFDAGIYETVQQLQPGEYYHLWVGFALAAVDKSGGVNTRDNEVGRMVGVDPLGGTDPQSPNVKWGPEFTNGGPALNIPALDGTFAAQADHVTVYIRAINHSSQYRHKAWFQTICMEPRPDLPTATPLASATATQGPTDTPRPTRPPVVVVPDTSVPTETSTPVPSPSDTPTTTNTPTPSLTPTETPKPRRAIPPGSPASTDSRTDALPIALFVGSIGIAMVSMIGIVGLLAFLLWHISRRRAKRVFSGSPYSFSSGYDEMEQFNEAIEPRLPPDEQLPSDIF
jgi:hypothetical protein